MFLQNINKQNLFSSLIFISLLNLVFNPVNVYFGFVLLVFFVLIFVFFNYVNITLLPFYFYPFVFVLKSQYPGNILFSALPEISVLVSFVYILFDRKIMKSEKHLILLIFLLAFSLTFFNFLFIFDIYYLPALIRQYSFPLIFLVFFIVVSLKNQKLPMESFKICTIAYGLIAIIALLNYFDFISVINTKYYRIFPACSNDIVQTFLDCKKGQLLRIQTLLGGSYGTAGSIFCMFALAIFINYKKNIHLIYFSIPLILAAFFSISFSVIIPIFLTLIIIILSNYRLYFKQILFIFAIIFILFISNFSFFGEKSIFVYFKLTLLNGIIDFYSKVDLINIFLGSGPIINSNKFEYFPENFIQDIGLLRILTETGVFNFIILMMILFYFLKKNIWLILNNPSNFNKSILVMLLTLLSSFHSIIFLTIPFFPIFVMVVSNIIVEYNLTKKTLRFRT